MYLNRGSRIRRTMAFLAIPFAILVTNQDVHAMDAASFESMYSAARAATASHDYKKALKDYQALASISPDLPALTLDLAHAEVAMKHPDAAFYLFARVVHQGVGADVATDPIFLSLHAQPGYAAVLAEARKQLSPVITAKVAFTLPDPELIPEGLAYDDTDQRFFASSTYLRKVIVRDQDGAYHDFVGTADHGLWQALGMKIDAGRGWLLICSGVDGPNMRDFKKPDLGKSAVFIYDLKSSRLIARYDVSTPGEHLFNDLVIGHKDDVYVTDSTEGSIYKLNLEDHRLLRLTPAKSLIYPNGIASSPDGTKLYVAEEGIGIDLVDPKTGAIRRLPHPEDVTTVGIDGLYYHDGYLIATQTDVHPNRVMAYRLTPELNRVTEATVLERGDPRMSSPTEGVVVGDNLYYLANSQQNSFDTDGRIWAYGKLSRTVVLELALP